MTTDKNDNHIFKRPFEMTPFELKVKRAFDPITERYHMRRRSSGESVVYENETVSLALGYDSKRTCEIQVLLGLVSDKRSDGRWLGLELILKDKGVEDAAWVAGLQVGNEKDLGLVLIRLAALLATHGAECLEGRPEVFARAARIKERGREQYALQQRLLVARAEADQAWKKRDYLKVTTSLESLEEHLSTAEKIRLKLARKRAVKRST